MGAGHILTFYVDACMRTCALSVSSTVGRSVDPSTTSRHFGAETKNNNFTYILFIMSMSMLDHMSLCTHGSP